MGVVSRKDFQTLDKYIKYKYRYWMRIKFILHLI